MKTTKGNSLLTKENYSLLLKYRSKKVRKIALFILFLFVIFFRTSSLFLSQSSSSYSPLVDSLFFEIDLHDIKIDIISIQEINIAEKYTVRNTQNTTLDSIDLWINQSLTNLLIKDLEGPLLFEGNQITDSSNFIKIYFRSELEKNSTTTFNVWYSLTNYPIPEQGKSYYFFEFHSSVSYFTKTQIIEIKIPETSTIHEEEGLTSFFPEECTPIAGKRVYLSWSFKNLEPFDNPFIFVRFDKPRGNLMIWISIVGPCCGVIAGICATILFMKRKERKVMKKVATIFLSDTQKTLLNLISENNGKILQKELCSKTGFTKSRISRNITPLVKQELVEREKWGRNYVITLTESGKKVVE